jgi:peptidoglycan hydrolase CwlO-like protein
MNRKTSLMGLVLLLSAFNQSQVKAEFNSSVVNNTSSTVEQRLEKIAKALHSKTKEIEELSQSQPEKTQKNQITGALKILLAEVTQWRNGPIWNDGSGFGNWRNQWRDFNPFIDFRNN